MKEGYVNVINYNPVNGLNILNFPVLENKKLFPIFKTKTTNALIPMLSAFPLRTYQYYCSCSPTHGREAPLPRASSCGTTSVSPIVTCAGSRIPSKEEAYHHPSHGPSRLFSSVAHQ